MKILHIDETFHPSFGYQLNSLAKYEAKSGNEIYIITTEHKKLHPAFKFSSDNDRILEYDEQYSKKNNVKIVRLPVYRFFSGRAIYNIKKLFRKIDEINPDVIMLHQVETFAAVIYILKRYYKKYPTVFDSHMLRMASSNKFAKIYNFCFRKFITPRINNNKIPVIRTQNDSYVNDVLGISSKITPFISFGTDTMLFYPDRLVKMQFRKENNISEDAFVVVYTGKMDKTKGGLLLAKALHKKFEIKDGREIVFVIVGNIYDDDYGNEVKKLFDTSENRIIRYPTQKYVDLPKFYQSADLNIYAKQCSLSFYDAQGCGVPVVSEGNNINVERNSHKNGYCFEAGNVEDFRSKIELCYSMIPKDYDVFKKNAVQFVVENYDYEKISFEYDKVINSAIKNLKKRLK